MSDLNINIDLYDHEVMQVGEVIAALNAGTHRPRDYGAFEREIIERFQDIELTVQVTWFETNVSGVLIPEITIVGRYKPIEFDHAQQAHEVQHDILGISEPGVITRDGTIRTPSKSTAFVSKE